jgi:hypothetical protein
MLRAVKKRRGRVPDFFIYFGAAFLLLSSLPFVSSWSTARIRLSAPSFHTGRTNWKRRLYT